MTFTSLSFGWDSSLGFADMLISDNLVSAESLGGGWDSWDSIGSAVMLVVEIIT